MTNPRPAPDRAPLVDWRDRDGRQALLDRVETLTAGPLTVAAILLLAAFLAPAIAPGLPVLHRARVVVVTAVWFLFAANLIAKLTIAPDRRRYLRGHWLEALIVVLPVFHPLLVAAAGTAGLRGYQGLRDLRGRLGLGYTLIAALLIVLLAAALVTEAERTATNATIANFGDGLWWAAATVTTVGYGDVAPVTAAGRGVGLALMVVGIATFGLVAANLASMLLGVDDDARARIDRLERELTEVRDLVADARQSDPNAGRNGEG